jgi:hypothetical protein
MGAEDFLKGLMENYDEENSDFVSVADVDEYGNVVYSNSVVVDAQPQLIGAGDFISLVSEPLEESKT